jgi:hypothetical protein
LFELGDGGQNVQYYDTPCVCPLFLCLHHQLVAFMLWFRSVKVKSEPQLLPNQSAF